MSWSGRVVGIDLLRGVAAFGIVGCHIQLVPRTCAGNLVVALCDFNVGLFAALAGFLMCGAAEVDGWFGYARKRVKRLLPAYFTWTVVFVVLTALFDIAYDGGCLNPRYMDVWFWLRVLFIGGCATHLCFLACLFYAQIAFFGLFASFKGRWWGGCVDCGRGRSCGWECIASRLDRSLSAAASRLSNDGIWNRVQLSRWCVSLVGEAQVDCVGINSYS